MRLGVAAGDHAAIIWPLLCGLAKAKYYLLTGEMVTGDEAERIGLVSKALPRDEVLPEALRIASQLATGPQLAVRLTKRALNGWVRNAGPIFDQSAAYEMLTFMGEDIRRGWPPCARSGRPSSANLGPPAATFRKSTAIPLRSRDDPVSAQTCAAVPFAVQVVTAGVAVVNMAVLKGLLVRIASRPADWRRAVWSSLALRRFRSRSRLSTVRHGRAEAGRPAADPAAAGPDLRGVADWYRPHRGSAAARSRSARTGW